ncbi:hypothetical protein OIO90_003710 [Microbotryomycetes sp. JL221]|nr:hypothetical protein OIO90_003710 [Microbotryomycetes sp. JL221]
MQAHDDALSVRLAKAAVFVSVSGDKPARVDRRKETMASTTNSTTSGGIVDKAKDAVNYVSESVQEAVSGASKEKNKEVAKGNTDASISERASAGLSAVSDKMDETKHSAKADAHKESAKH